MLFALGAPIAVAFDDEGLCVMQKSIQQRGCHGGVTGEDSWPVFESDVGGNDNRAALVTFGDNLKEQLCTALVQGEVAQFVNEQDPWALVTLELAGQLTVGFGGT